METVKPKRRPSTRRGRPASYMPYIITTFLLFFFLVMVAKVTKLHHRLRYKSTATVSLHHSLEKIRPGKTFTGQDSLILYVARNEYESFQVVVNGELNNVRASVDVPWSCGNKPCVALHRAVYLNITTVSDCRGALGLWPDPLIPDVDVFHRQKRSAFPFNVPANDNRVVWVDLFVPPTVLPGTYQGHVAVSSGEEFLKFSLQLTIVVWSATLPSTSQYATEFGFNVRGAMQAQFGKDVYNTTVYRNLTKLYLDAALMHKVTLGRFLMEEPTIVTREKIDWRGFEAHWLSYLTGHNLPFGLDGVRVTSAQIPYPFCTFFVNVTARCASADRHTHRLPRQLTEGKQAKLRGYPACTDQEKEEQVEYWKTVFSYFDEKGWSHLLYDYTQDEPHTDEQWENIRVRATYVHKATPKLSVLVTTEMDRAKAKNVSQLIDLWVPIINFVDAKPGCYAQNQRPLYDSCKMLWWYQSCMSDGCNNGCRPTQTCEMDWPSYMIDHSAIKNRIMSWMSYLENMQGELYWGTNAFDSQNQSAWQSQLLAGGNGDGTLFYPGTPEKIGGTSHIPVASIRLKQIRDGLEDLELMRMAEEKAGGRQKVLSLIQTTVQRAYKFTDNPVVLLEARHAVGSLLDAKHSDILPAGKPNSASDKPPKMRSSHLIIPVLFVLLLAVFAFIYFKS